MNYVSSRKFKMGDRRLTIALVALLTGISGTVVASALVAYEAFFPRYERPNYALYPGEYCYERVKDRLYREEFYFNSNKAKLKAYYYPAKNSKGLIVLAHGMHSGADDYIPIIEYMVNSGYNVFAYDATGTYDSKGFDTIGMCQAVIDIDHALKYIKKTSPYKDQPIFLIGHSWGGYAVSSVLELHKDVKACACIAPMNNGYTVMYQTSQMHIGKMALPIKPVFEVYQKILFGRYTECNGVRGINSSGVPVLIAQGDNDEIIPKDKLSITAYKHLITNPNVRYIDTTGLQGDHNDLWHSIECINYKKQLSSQLAQLEKEKQRELTKEELAEFYTMVDHRLYSQVNEKLMQKIVKTFNQANK